MNKDFWERIDRLEELAGKAMQGEWKYESWNENINCNERRIGVVLPESGEYIAAANPAMILEMIARMERYWDDAATYASYAQYLAAYVGLYDGTNDEVLTARRVYFAVFSEIQELRAAKQRLEKEADFLAEELASVYKSEFEGAMDLLDASGWREAAHKAVKDANNA